MKTATKSAYEIGLNDGAASAREAIGEGRRIEAVNPRDWEEGHVNATRRAESLKALGVSAGNSATDKATQTLRDYDRGCYSGWNSVADGPRVTTRGRVPSASPPAGRTPSAPSSAPPVPAGPP